MIRHFEIQNFRGIKGFHIEELRRFNLFLGYNNSGKSSLLEALFLYASPSRPVFDIVINRLRGYRSVDKDSLTANFYGRNTTNRIVFSGGDGDTRRQLQITYVENLKEKEVIQEQANSEIQPHTYGLRHDLTITDGNEEGQSYSFRMIPNDDDSVNNQWLDGQNYRETLLCGYMPPVNGANDDIAAFKKMLEDKNEGAVRDALREIEPMIQEVSLIDNQIMVDVGFDKRMPIQLLGDGIRKLFSIIVFIYQMKGGIVLLDEVDNGLHYRSMPTLWKTILSTASKYDVQVFATTHNIDSLRGLTQELRDVFPQWQEDVNVYTLRKQDGGVVVPIRSVYSQFEYLISQEIELR